MLNAKVRNKARISILTTFILYHTGGPGQYNKAKNKEKKRQRDWNGRNKLFLLTVYIIAHVENPKEATQTPRTYDK